MTRYVCTKCSYRLEKETAPARCPYCSKDGTLQREKNAQELLEESNEFDGE
ncbi:MAG: hypothetical protein ABIC95_02680 [archaeon]